MVDGQGVRTSARVVVVATAVLVATVIGSTADAASGGSKRPEGPWTMVNWEVSRTPPSSDYVPGTASISLLAYSPRCASGPCALRVRPAGRNGTYNAAGEPVTKDADRSTHRFNWNGKDAVYTAHRDYGRVSCTTSDGAGGVKTVPDGFTQTSDATYRFRPARSRVPASMTGERVSTATGTPEGVPQGCTDISVTARVAGSPTGSVQVTARGASGHYRITETVERTEPATDRPRGFTGILVPDSTIAAQGRGLTLTGIVGTARLRPTRAGWTGSVKDTRPSCVSSSTAPGYDATETWTGIRPVARTETGAPILAGTWRYVANPTASGVADGCSLTTNRGFVILVPLGAIGP